MTRVLREARNIGSDPAEVNASGGFPIGGVETMYDAAKSWRHRRIAVKEIEADQAAGDFDSLLDLVKRGEQVIIRQEGAEVARLVPPPGNSARPAVSKEEAAAAIRRIRERAEKAKLGPFDWEEWKAYRDEGRP
jgi:antitoxin (DNA-binding transcriptional repressor) of toxin-antitoxin stability system